MGFFTNIMVSLLATAVAAVPQTIDAFAGTGLDTAIRAEVTATPTLVSVSGCAAVVSTTDICSTCFTADCVVLATITVNTDCGCPATPVTIYSSHPCDLGCDGLGCGTAYTVVTTSGAGACTQSASPPSASATTTGAPD
ncbi:hypothetical protein B0H63DRAFT_463296 [Podospora didyma]|uniref:Uncharacterized protein n=1 Tax=Podospora didyma TaxID=330526 RepID=A0AAE0NX00_9PEZI|nr:hypothetical protein B0H63DRAFT_463296 [Podospora didyma]